LTIILIRTRLGDLDDAVCGTAVFVGVHAPSPSRRHRGQVRRFYRAESHPRQRFFRS
jgi:hypothetical protein